MRAHRPRRFGTTASSRPPAASTRHTSRSSAAGSCVISKPCTSSTRSTALSASGSSFSSTSAESAGRVVGHFTTPCPAGMKAEAALGLLAEQAEIGRGIADAEHALAGGVAPQAADAAADEAAGHHAQPLAIEIAQVHDIDRHGLKSTCAEISTKGAANRGCLGTQRVPDNSSACYG